MCILLSGKFHKHFLPGLALHHQNNEVLMSEDLDPDKEKILTPKTISANFTFTIFLASAKILTKIIWKTLAQ